MEAWKPARWKTARIQRNEHASVWSHCEWMWLAHFGRQRRENCITLFDSLRENSNGFLWDFYYPRSILKVWTGFSVKLTFTNYFLVQKDQLEFPKLPTGCNLSLWGVLVLLICVQILVCLDCFSHNNIVEVWKPARWKTAKIHWNEHTPGNPVLKIQEHLWKTQGW